MVKRGQNLESEQQTEAAATGVSHYWVLTVLDPLPTSPLCNNVGSRYISPSITMRKEIQRGCYLHNVTKLV